MKNRLLIIDGNALFYRAFHAFPGSLTTPDGTPSNAAFGFTKILLGAIKQIQPTHLVVCFDAPGGTFRDELFDAYKATRAAMPENLVTQVPLIWELVDALEVPRFVLQGFEADDLIGTLSKQANEAGDTHTVIVSGDQDLIQLVDETVSVLSPGKTDTATLLTPEAVMSKYGFAPLRMIDYKALAGDSSDNIPGIPGVGEKTAKELLATFETVENMYRCLEAGETRGLRESLVKKVLENKKSALTSFTLATITRDAPVVLSLDAAKLSLEKPAQLVTLFQKLGFKSLLRELPGSHALVTAASDVFETQSPAEPPPQRTESDELDTALEPVLRKMEATGALVDTAYLATLETAYTTELEGIRKKLIERAGREFNPDSPSQVADVLFNTLGASTTGVKKGKTGFSTDADTLQALAPTLPFASELLEYRQITKLISTYCKPLQEMVDGNHRIHTTYAPDTATGRISSKNPNLQNIPVRSERGMAIRRAFIAPSGNNVLLKADYSQIELRVAAHFSGDDTMIEAFKGGRDFHAETAARMGVDRHVAKIVNFSILYGKGAFGFSQDMGVSFAEAQKTIQQYYRTFSGLKRWIDATLETAEAHGFVETWLGRRRPLPALQGGNAVAKAAAKREAVNTIIQGSAAEILKRAMVTVAPLLPAEARMILTVHDELILECNEAQLAQVAEILEETMIHAANLSVDLEVSLASGKNWADTKPLSR